MMKHLAIVSQLIVSQAHKMNRESLRASYAPAK